MVVLPRPGIRDVRLDTFGAGRSDTASRFSISVSKAVLTARNVISEGEKDRDLHGWSVQLRRWRGLFHLFKDSTVMDFNVVTRRSFLSASAGVAATLLVSDIAQGSPAHRAATGLVYGRVGAGGVPAGSDARPSRGTVMLLDGTTIPLSHAGSRPILPGKSVLLAPDTDGNWSVLYAEV